MSKTDIFWDEFYDDNIREALSATGKTQTIFLHRAAMDNENTASVFGSCASSPEPAKETNSLNPTNNSRADCSNDNQIYHSDSANRREFSPRHHSIGEDTWKHRPYQKQDIRINVDSKVVHTSDKPAESISAPCQRTSVGGLLPLINRKWESRHNFQQESNKNMDQGKETTRMSNAKDATDIEGTISPSEESGDLYSSESFCSSSDSQLSDNLSQHIRSRVSAKNQINSIEFLQSDHKCDSIPVGKFDLDNVSNCTTPAPRELINGFANFPSPNLSSSSYSDKGNCALFLNESGLPSPERDSAGSYSNNESNWPRVSPMNSKDFYLSDISDDDYSQTPAHSDYYSCGSLHPHHSEEYAFLPLVAQFVSLNIFPVIQKRNDSPICYQQTHFKDSCSLELPALGSNFRNYQQHRERRLGQRSTAGRINDNSGLSSNESTTMPKDAVSGKSKSIKLGLPISNKAVVRKHNRSKTKDKRNRQRSKWTKVSKSAQKLPPIDRNVIENRAAQPPFDTILPPLPRVRPGKLSTAV